MDEREAERLARVESDLEELKRELETETLEKKEFRRKEKGQIFILCLAGIILFILISLIFL